MASYSLLIEMLLTKPNTHVKELQSGNKNIRHNWQEMCLTLATTSL